MALGDTGNHDYGRDWTLVAADGTEFLLAVAGPGVLEVAITRATLASTVPPVLAAGYELARLSRESLSRQDVPVGHVWARAQPSGIVETVQAVLTAWV